MRIESANLEAVRELARKIKFRNFNSFMHRQKSQSFYHEAETRSLAFPFKIPPCSQIGINKMDILNDFHRSQNLSTPALWKFLTILNNGKYFQ